MLGGNGDDRFHGNTFAGTNDNDVLKGEAGDDWFYYNVLDNSGTDTLLGGQGNDEFIFRGSADDDFNHIVLGGGGLNDLMLRDSLHLDLTTMPDNQIQDIRLVTLSDLSQLTLNVTDAEGLVRKATDYFFIDTHYNNKVTFDTLGQSYMVNTLGNKDIYEFANVSVGIDHDADLTLV